MLDTKAAELNEVGLKAIDTSSEHYRSGFKGYSITTSPLSDKTVDPNEVCFPYHIKSHYLSSASQNTILCKTILSDIEYFAEISFSFSTLGTSGTNYTLVLTPNL
jgi:hypothetical protein